jgi:tryptophanase
MTQANTARKERTLAEPFKIKMVETLKTTTEAYRKDKLKEAGYNTFLLHSEDVYIDFLTDSGTSAMSDKQWAGMMMGDESYAGARSWLRLEEVVKDLTGMPFVLPTHQGRAAERILYGIIGGNNKVFLSNTHFDTTRANIEYTGATALDLMSDENTNPELDMPFKGNIDLEQLKAQIQIHGKEQIAAVIMTITNNSSGGQPVSMENVKAVRQICDEHGLILVLDACRIAENSYFVKHREDGYGDRTYKSIATEMLQLGDVFVMSAKKDGLVNMGGLLVLKNPELHRQCVNMLIISEGFATYGGLTGRDMEALATGLQEVFEEGYLHYRIKSTEYLGAGLKKKGVPVVWPIGGHAVYIDAGKLYSHIPVDQYPGQVLVADLYTLGGIRAVEVGSVMFGKNDENGDLMPARRELVRLAIPRRVYTQSHIDFVLDVFDDILEMTDRSSGLKFVYEPPFLRHFTARFEWH